MFLGSEILEVALSITFVYLLMSLIASSFSEWVAQLFAMRAHTLEEGVRSLLYDPKGRGLARAFFNHPLIETLAKQSRFDKLLGRFPRPSYVAGETFATTLLDLLAPIDEQAGPKTIEQVKLAVERLPDPKLRRALLIKLAEADDDLAALRENLAIWFDDAMDRVSGWYKRKSQGIVLIFAIVFVTAMNVDTFTIGQSLIRDRALRDSVVGAAEQRLQQDASAEAAAATLEDVQENVDELRLLELPIGWRWPNSEYDDPREFPTTLSDFLLKIFGLATTIAATSLGAPFWFDTLSQLNVLRSTGKKPSPTARR